MPGKSPQMVKLCQATPNARLDTPQSVPECLTGSPPRSTWIGLDWILFIVVTITDNCLITIDPLEGKMQKDMNN